VEFDIKYNSSKSAVLICRTKQDKWLNFPVFMLANNCLEVCKKKPKYLGHCIADDILVIVLQMISMMMITYCIQTVL